MKNSILLILFSVVLIRASEIVNVDRASENLDLVIAKQDYFPRFTAFKNKDFFIELNKSLISGTFNEELKKTALLENIYLIIRFYDKKELINDLNKNIIIKYDVGLKEMKEILFNLNQRNSNSFESIDGYEKIKQEQLENNEIRDYEYSIMNPWESNFVIKNNDV